MNPRFNLNLHSKMCDIYHFGLFPVAAGGFLDLKPSGGGYRACALAGTWCTELRYQEISGHVWEPLNVKIAFQGLMRSSHGVHLGTAPP